MENQQINRRKFLQAMGFSAVSMLVGSSVLGCAKSVAQSNRPNILLAIADDQTWQYAGAYGSKIVQTKSFDRVAREGILFTHAYCPAPQCSPSRAALLTGKNIWQIEEAGTHSSLFPKKFQVYPDVLEASGYFVGFTGKGWAPGNWKDAGRKRNPAGTDFSQRKLIPPTSGISSTDYAGNFEAFLEKRPKNKPFCFWYGGHEPHRKYEKDSGLKAGKKPQDATVPDFLPDNSVIRNDLLDFGLEIDWFDQQLGKMIQKLEESGELDNTLVVVTADNGMPFPRAKANMYEFGTHVPLAMRWKTKIMGGRTVEDLVSFIDLAPTFLEVGGLKPLPDMTGKSLLPVLLSAKSGWLDSKRNRIFTGRERHTHARPDNLGYPARAIRTKEYLYIWNMKPNRWPAGDPEGFYDIDGSPSKTYLLDNKKSVEKYFDLAVGLRPEEELYAVEKDPGCMKNLAGNPEYNKIKKDLQAELESTLKKQGDPRVLGYGDIFDSYPRFAHMRGDQFSGFAKRGKYNPKYQKMAEEEMKKLGIKK